MELIFVRGASTQLPPPLPQMAPHGLPPRAANSKEVEAQAPGVGWGDGLELWVSGSSKFEAHRCAFHRVWLAFRWVSLV